jgi:FemAB-related protein (PEP-CTERM system-associated)
MEEDARTMMTVDVHDDLSESLRREVAGYLWRVGPTSGACAGHDPRWLLVLRDGLGHKPYMIVARKRSDDTSAARNGDAGSAGAICGYLPLTLVASRLFGRFLVSLPYLDRAGVVAAHPVIAAAVVERAAALAAHVDAHYLELRQHRLPIVHEALDASIDAKVRMVLPLPGERDFLWKTLAAKVRNQVRKGEQNNFDIRFGGSELVDDFCDVLAVHMRDLGTPIYSRELFAQVLWRFGDEAELAIVRRAGRPIAGALLVHDRSMSASLPSTQVLSAGGLRAFNRVNANVWMYYHLLERAIERGSSEFDFGRSRVDSGTYRFKKQWGAHAEPTQWQYHVRHGSIADVRPDNPRYRRRMEMWRKMPVWLTRVIGPPIIRGIP